MISRQADVAPLAVAPCLLAEAAEVTASLRDYLRRSQQRLAALAHYGAIH